jgi:hypothetical protein
MEPSYQIWIWPTRLMPSWRTFLDLIQGFVSIDLSDIASSQFNEDQMVESLIGGCQCDVKS